MPSFLYPRVISIRRPRPATGVGELGYSGTDAAEEDELVSNIPAHIQVERQGTVPDSKLPADAAGQSIWRIVFKAPKGLCWTGDIIDDEMGHRYQIISAAWGPLVTTARCQVLQS